MAVPKKKKSYMKCNKKYTAWRNKKNSYYVYNFCNTCFLSQHQNKLYVKTNFECFFCAKNLDK